MAVAPSTRPGTCEPRASTTPPSGAVGAITVMLAAIVADVASKAAAHAWAPPHTTANIGLVGFVRPVWNHDFSLEIWGTSPAVATLMMTGVAIAGTALALRLSRHGHLPLVVVGLGAGGAFANLLDRTLHGAVADFLVMGPIVINLADLAVAAAVLTLWSTLLADARQDPGPHARRSPRAPRTSAGQQRAASHRAQFAERADTRAHRRT